jgi:hypothetical protein
MVSQGERPGYRVQPLPDGRWEAVGLPGVTVAAPSRSEAVKAMREAIVVLEVPREAFDLET